jgi:hypothetical protein
MNRMLLGAACTLILAFAAVADEKPAVKDEPGKDKPGSKTVTVTGMIKKVDPSAHMLTITVADGKSTMDREFHITKETRFTFYTGDQKKEAVGINAYKNEQLKEKAKVEVVADDQGKLAEVRIGAPQKKE